MHPKSVLNYFERVGAEVLNFRRAMVKTYKGNYYIERAIIKLLEDGTVVCSVKEFAPTEEEVAAMKADLAKVEWPKTIKARSTDALRKLIKGDEIYEFIDRATGEIIMVQQRRDNPKKYVPWTMLSTGQWVAMEPDGALPFWKPPVNSETAGRIMIHEGAKVAAFVTKLIADGGRGHPWYEELKTYEHWGMIGGALAPHRSDYDELSRESPSEVVYVCDNDQPGISALQKVSQCWNKPLKGIAFGKKFPPGWDMADDIPDALIARGGRYVGPKLKDLLQAATWATMQLPNPEGKGRPVTVIKPEFSEEWLHCVTPEVFVHREWPNRILGPNEFNSAVAPFSHVDDTARLLKRDFSSKGFSLKYNPAEKSGIHGGTSGSYINTFCPSDIGPEPGDVGPWLDFMQELILDDDDRMELMRWCATLIARPDVRMMYGVLLISEMQGVGKGTLGEKILAPLVGPVNVSYPSEQEIVDSNFNYWLAHKRLGVVHEIYAGHSSKAYNKLKSCITDKNVTVQKKYQANYEIDSWIHIFACSNSMRALKLANDDRRWFVPKVSEEKRSATYWEGLNRWLTQEGGLHIIRWWAEEFCRTEGAVQSGAAAPWSKLKQTIIEENYSPGQLLVQRVLTGLKARIDEGEVDAGVFVLDTQLVEMIKNELHGGRPSEFLERPATVRSVAKALGMHSGEIRAQVKAWGPESFGARVMSFDPEVAKAAPSDLGGEKLPEAERRRPYDFGAVAGM